MTRNKGEKMNVIEAKSYIEKIRESVTSVNKLPDVALNVPLMPLTGFVVQLSGDVVTA